MQVETKTPDEATPVAVKKPTATKVSVATKSPPTAQPKKAPTPAVKVADKPPVEDVRPEIDAGAAIASLVSNPSGISNQPANAASEPEESVTLTVDPSNQDSRFLPSNIQFEEADTNPEGVGVVVKIFGTGCLECACLVEDPSLGSPDTLPACHFSKGQDLCPARAVRIKPVGEQVLFVRKWNKAKESKDSNRLLRLAADLNKLKDIKMRDEIMQEIGILGS